MIANQLDDHNIQVNLLIVQGTLYGCRVSPYMEYFYGNANFHRGTDTPDLVFVICVSLYYRKAMICNQQAITSR